MAQARASEARWLRGAPLSALDGVPVTLKDNIATQGDPMPLGTAAVEAAACRRRAAGRAPARSRRRHHHQDHHARLRHAVLGLSSFHPLARNPWDLRKTPGGSSAGRGRGRRRGLWPAAPGHRHRRLHPPAGGLVRRLQPQAQPGPRADRPALHRPRRRPHDAHVADAALMMQVLSCPTRATA
jgi:aspartyl-tRNA(Asn)/glutamyl-tRNA(Gln) amidotransferase subunit A